MKYLKDVPSLMDDDLTIEQRGLLITMILLRDDDSKLTLAKFKAKVSLIKFRDELIELQDMNFIEWSGYNNAKKAQQTKEINPDVIEAVNFMNGLWKTKHDYKTKGFYSNLVQRLKDHGLEAVKSVISNRYEEWKDDVVMFKYLTPHTIFRPSKFDKYLEEFNRNKKGKFYLDAAKFDISAGDELTFDMIDMLADKDAYSVTTYQLNESGKRIGGGIKSLIYGKDLKISLKIGKNIVASGRRSHTQILYTP